MGSKRSISNRGIAFSLAVLSGGFVMAAYGIGGDQSSYNGRSYWFQTTTTGFSDNQRNNIRAYMRGLQEAASDKTGKIYNLPVGEVAPASVQGAMFKRITVTRQHKKDKILHYAVSVIFTAAGNHNPYAEICSDSGVINEDTSLEYILPRLDSCQKLTVQDERLMKDFAKGANFLGPYLVRLAAPEATEESVVKRGKSWMWRQAQANEQRRPKR